MRLLEVYHEYFQRLFIASFIFTLIFSVVMLFSASLLVIFNCKVIEEMTLYMMSFAGISFGCMFFFGLLAAVTSQFKEEDKGKGQ